MYDFWLYLVYRPYDPLWVLTSYLANLIDFLVDVILRVVYLYFFNITCEWWVLLFLSSFYAPFLANQTFHKAELAAGECLWLRGKHSSCTHRCDAHCRLPAEYLLIVSLQSSESASLWPSGWPFYPLEILGRSDNPGSVLRPTNSCIQSSECRFNYLHQWLLFMNQFCLQETLDLQGQ